MTVEGRGEGAALDFAVSPENVGVALGSWVLSKFVGRGVGVEKVGRKVGTTVGTSVGLELGFRKVQLPKIPVGTNDGT